ncbi:hypothetical protein GLOIN_2v1528288 [Rhizophagus irregularis DAOM 181602=DAOM 197198]|nr:hypothetical protein GLOIN_2v1528288 [Rhizophagus irregularis DAOM 181602=DAOM 197198]
MISSLLISSKTTRCKYKQAIDDYFKTSVLEKEKTYVDKTLTKKTSKAIRSRIDESPSGENWLEKPRLMESQQNDDSSILMSADPKIKQEFPVDFRKPQSLQRFSNFQQKTIKQSRKIRIYVFKKDFHKILDLEHNLSKTNISVLSLVITTVISEYSSLLNCFASLDEIEDRWCANFAKNVSRPLLELVWANSESTASKRQRSNDKENTVKDFIKLGDFQVATLNEIIKKHGNKNGLISFGIWVTGARIRFYEMDLSYDGIYRMVLVSNVVIPTERAQFLNLMTVLEAFFNIKRRISEVITVIASNTPPNSPSRSTYGRVPTSSPKPVKVTISGLQPN